MMATPTHEKDPLWPREALREDREVQPWFTSGDAERPCRLTKGVPRDLGVRGARYVPSGEILVERAVENVSSYDRSGRCCS